MKTHVKTKFTATHRFLHAIIAVLMLLLYITGFLRMYWMSKKTLLLAVETTLTNQNVTMEQKQLIPIARAIQAPMWQWHEYAAVALALMFFVRIIYMLACGIRFPSPFKKVQPFKKRLHGMVYLLFYVFTGISIITGFYLKWGDGTYKAPMEAIHKWGLYWFLSFVVLHFAGILIAELRDNKGIASKMIGGD